MMKIKLLSKLALKNFKTLKHVMVPFILAVSTMFALEYIMLSMMANDYINTRHKDLPQLMMYANVLVTILSVIFILYASQFVMKQRKKEFALNMVLGLEKRHLRLMLLIETLVQTFIIIVLSTIGGYLFGHLIFLMLNRLIQGSGIRLMDYPFDIDSAIKLWMIIIVMMIVLYIMNIITVTLQSPIKLMQTQYAGEKKTRQWLIILLLVLGIIALGYGYTTALTTDGVMNALMDIFKAVLAVLVGTYFLFMSLTIFFLQQIQKISSIYYKKKNFFSISGMLSRMKANAIGIASITMLCTFLIVTLGMSLSAYRGIETQIDGALFQENEVSFVNDDIQLEKLQKEIEGIATIDQFRMSEELVVPFHIGERNQFEQVRAPGETNQSIEDNVYSVLMTEQDHNEVNDTKLKLKDNEIFISSNTDKYQGLNKIILANNQYNVKTTKKNFLGSKFGIDGLYIVVKDHSILKKIIKEYKSYNPKTQEYDISPTLSRSMHFNITKGEDQFIGQIERLEEEYGISIANHKEISKELYELNGGLIFIGIVVSIVLLIGMFLILYYKQLSEGYEDKLNYTIMKQVGLPDNLIKSTIRKQVFWLFGLPIIVALIHTAFANKIIYQLLGLLAIRDYWLFITSYSIVIILIVLIYLLMYWVTSHIYYKLINKSNA
ncbi:Putative hemin transport system permease protein HrtB [Abyssicoccus albus]